MMSPACAFDASNETLMRGVAVLAMPSPHEGAVQSASHVAEALSYRQAFSSEDEGLPRAG